MRSGTGRLVAAGLLAALGTLLPGAPAKAAEPAFGLTVIPTHGPATTTVHASYRTFGLQGRCPPMASFSWDGLPVGTAGFTISGRSCLYLLSFVPPSLDRAPGPHTVEATAATSATTVYRIDPTGSPSPDPSPSAKASPTPRPSRTRATPTPTLSTEDALPLPTPSDQSAPVAPAGVPTQVAAPASNWTAWAMVGGGALVLGGVLVIGWLVLQNRRAGRADDASDTPTVEQPRLDAP